jgi:hypothetical protein
VDTFPTGSAPPGFSNSPLSDSSGKEFTGKQKVGIHFATSKQAAAQVSIVRTEAPQGSGLFVQGQWLITTGSPFIFRKVYP